MWKQKKTPMSKFREYKKINLSYRTKWEKWFFDKYLFQKYKIKRQSIVWRRICDFIIPSKWVRIEIDWSHHNTKWHKAYDLAWDRHIFEMWWYITLRVVDFDEQKANKVMKFVEEKQYTWLKQIRFIKKHIRGKKPEEVNESDYSWDEKNIVLYWKSLYKQNKVKEKKVIKVIKEKSTNSTIKVKTLARQKHTQQPKEYSFWVNLFYSVLQQTL